MREVAGSGAWFEMPMVLAVMFLAGAPAPASAADAVPATTQDAASDPPSVVQPGPSFATPTTPDSVGRVVAPVFVNGRGPFRFIVDSGANRSALSPHLAQALGLDTASPQQVLVHGVTGAESAPVAHVGELRFGVIARHGLDLPVVSNRINANADGLLGADHLSGARLLIDFRHDRIEIGAAGRRVSGDFHVMPARMRFGQLPLVAARLGAVRVSAVIDTGAERSIGNSALRRVLEQSSGRLQDRGITKIYGAVGPDTDAMLAIVPHLELGGMRVERLPILFADTHFFQIWDLENEPAMLIGMDLLGQVDALVIDYRRNEVSFRLPDDRARGPGRAQARAKATRL